MENHQIRAISTSPYQLEQWFWYADDFETKCKSDEAKQILDHWNSIEPGVICLTMKDILNDEIAVSDFKQKIDRKRKSIEFSVKYEKTHTNTNVDMHLTNRRWWKWPLLKDSAIGRDPYVSHWRWKRTWNFRGNLCYVKNGYTKEVVLDYLSERQPKVVEDKDDKLDRGTVTVPYLKGLF